MFDFGAVSTALAGLIGAIMTGLVTWKTMQRDHKKDLQESHLSSDHQHNQEQREWRAELNAENDKLRERLERKNALIEKLLGENFELRLKVTDLTIANREYKYDSTSDGKPTPSPPKTNASADSDGE